MKRKNRRGISRVLTLAMIAQAGLSGCLPLAALDLAPMGMHAVEAVGVATGQSVSGRTTTDEEDAAKCDQLRSGSPYVTEVRKDADGAFELRQWALRGNSETVRWSVVRGRNASSDGWRRSPNIGELEFSPPLETALQGADGRYLIFAPAQAADTVENEQLVSFISFFGPAEGVFHWRGRTYTYAVAKSLPCFSRAT